MIGHEEVEVRLGSETVALRPALRTAARLLARHGSFEKLIHGVMAGSVGAIADVIAEAGNLPRALVVDLISKLPVQEIVTQLAGEIFKFLLVLIGVDNKASPEAPDAAQKHSTQAGALTYEQYLEKLFGIGTGVLGWTPKDTWDSTPSEILAAYKARNEFVGDILKAVFGSKDETGSTGPQEHTADEIATGWAKLKTMARTGANRRTA